MDSERYLAEVFDALTTAGTRDECVHLAAQAAKTLADANGLCAVSLDGERCVLARADMQQICLCDLRNSSLYRAAVSQRRVENGGARTLWGKEDSIALSTGEQLRIGTALVVPLQVDSYVAVGFFWQPGRTTDSQHARKLELLGKALGLASSRWRKDDEHADEQRILADQQHRLRNNLALVRSIIRRSHETAESAEHFALHLEARISALTRIQGALVSAGAAGVELEEVVRTELLASAVPERSCVVQGPAVRLHDKCAELLALTIHELATNSLKFGALAVGDGRLDIRWSVAGGPLRLTWNESGVTIASAAPRRRGFGQELIERSLPYELGAHGQLTFNPGGMNCDIHLPQEACAWAVEPAAPAMVHGGGSW
jgi:two-component sensor histidine kinase